MPSSSPPSTSAPAPAGPATPPPGSAGWTFDNSYARLPGHFYARSEPVAVKQPRLVHLNTALAESLGLDVAALRSQAGVQTLAGNVLPPGAQPLAMAYAGHQFGHFVPQLGDGRAVLLGELVDRQGQRHDVALKGAGRTPFSRGGDGRAALGPVIREHVLSEAMHALGVPTTRSLAAVATGEPVFRETALPGGILTRVALSHVRVGTFQYFAARDDRDALRRLADYVIARLYPDADAAPGRHLALYQAVCDAQAALVARWMHIGFIHGVMNTDNTALSGETIDYGPCAFLDHYDPGIAFSSIDRQGRYALGNQSGAAQWNLARFGETLLPLLDDDNDRAIAAASEVLSSFQPTFEREWLSGMRRKLGLSIADGGDAALVDDWLTLMRRHTVDYTIAFRALCGSAVDDTGDRTLAARFGDDPALAAWLRRWRTRLARESGPPTAWAERMRGANPARIPRNHRVAQAIDAAVTRDDFTETHALIQALSQPYSDWPAMARYEEPPAAQERVLQTFCGT